MRNGLRLTVEQRALMKIVTAAVIFRNGRTVRNG